MKKAAMIIFVLFAIIACSQKIMAPAEELIPAMQKKVPGITMERARKGYELYSKNCSGCHHLYATGKYSIEQWNKLLPEMFVKAKIKDEDQQSLIRDYVHSLSK